MTARRLSLAVAASLAALLGLSASARAQMPEIPPGKWWKRPAIVQKLALTADQQEKLEEIFAKNRRAFVDFKADVDLKQIDVEELMAKKDSDPKKVAAALDASEQAKSKLRKAMSMMVLDMRGVLTDKQWQQILERRDEWRQERQQELRERMRGRGRRGGPGGPPEDPPPSSKDSPKE
jgi:Spy/CpxP family protein refolding chaperone